MTSKLVFWTAWNSYQSEKCLAGKPAGTVHPVKTMDPGILKRDFGR